MPSADFAGRARDYDGLRPLDDGWWRLSELLVAVADLSGRRVLDVGCGTGRLCAALAQQGIARVWGVDAEPKMIEVARERVPSTVGLKEGRAEALPFRDNWFDRVVFWLSAHLVDRPAAFAEAARVLSPQGRIAIVTFEPEHFEQHWAAAYFPSLASVDRARFPMPTELRKVLPEAGFGPPRLLPVAHRGTVDRATALERIQGRYISTFDLLDPAEVEEGTERAERELPDKLTWEARWLIVLADRAP